MGTNSRSELVTRILSSGLLDAPHILHSNMHTFQNVETYVETSWNFFYRTVPKLETVEILPESDH